jgi:hypothetical protein
VRAGVATRVVVTAGVTNGARTEVEAAALREGDEVALDETDATATRAGARMRMF